MVRMTSPTGVTVNVSDEKADRLASVGYVPVNAEKKAPDEEEDGEQSEK